MKRVLKHKKILGLVLAALTLVLIFLSVTTDKKQDQVPAADSSTQTDAQTNTPSDNPAELARQELRAQQDQLAQKVFTKPLPNTAAAVDVAYVKNVIAEYAQHNQLQLTDADLTQLAEPILQMRSLIQQAKQNIANEEDPFTSEAQVRFMTDLMEGENGFKQKLGVTLSDFVDSLPDEQAQILFGGDEDADSEEQGTEEDAE